MESNEDLTISNNTASAWKIAGDDIVRIFFEL